jgi:hypothetical protein
MKLIKLCLIFLIVNMTTIVSAQAYNLSFANYSPLYYFTQEDARILQQSISQALTSTKDGNKLTWKNPKSGAWGYLVPNGTVTKNGVTCRNLTSFNNAHKVSGEATYKYCKIHGKWVITS